ncbi:MAG: STAS domain-containing protein, partial [Acidimicrobiales bacterium]
AGGRTQLSGLFAAAVVVVLVPAAGGLRDVPVATLAAILIYMATRIFHLSDLVAILRFDLFEFALAVVTMLTVAFVGVEQGIGVAVGLAILDRARLSARPNLHVMGRIPRTTSWGPVDERGEQSEVPGVVVLLFAAPLYYANAHHFRAQIDEALQRARPYPSLVVLDVVGMHDIDYTGSRVLKEVLDELDQHHVTVALARAGDHLCRNLEHGGLLERFGPPFASVDEAVTTLGPHGGA